MSGNDGQLPTNTLEERLALERYRIDNLFEDLRVRGPAMGEIRERTNDLEDLVLQLVDRVEKLEQAWRDINSTKRDCSVSIDLAGHYVPDPGAVIAKAIKAME